MKRQVHHVLELHAFGLGLGSWLLLVVCEQFKLFPLIDKRAGRVSGATPGHGGEVQPYLTQHVLLLRGRQPRVGPGVSGGVAEISLVAILSL